MHPSKAKSLTELVQLASLTYGKNCAIKDSGRILSYQELEEISYVVYSAFSNRDIKVGDRICIWAPNQLEWIITAIGIQMSGAILVPMNTRLKGAEAGYILRNSGAKMLFTMENFLDTNYSELLKEEDLPSIKETIFFDRLEGEFSWSDFVNSGSNQRPLKYQDNLLADIIFTSGTTGNPKGVMTKQNQNLKVFETWSRHVGLEEGDRYLIVNPFFHTFGYKAGWLSCLMRGAIILPHQVFEAEAVLKRIQEDKITVLPGPPSLYQSILACPKLNSYDISSLRLAVTGAAAIPVQLIKDMKKILGFDTVLTAYGLTESTGVVSMCNPEDEPEIIATTSGKAIQGVEIKCVDSSGNICKVEESGEIYVRGYNVMTGYYNDPERTREVIDEDGWLKTGDIGILDALGYLKITDRSKDMFIVGGFNAYPAEIENTLAFHPAISSCAVIGIPDKRLGEVGKAFVVLEENSQLSENELMKWCKEKMANYKVPREVVFVKSLPMNASGKVMKFKLKMKE